MINKLVELRNIGKFRNYSASGDVSFRRFTLIYADNGSGKTTVTSLLRSLQSGDGDVVIERRTLGSVDNPIAKILTEDKGLIEYNGGWSDRYPDLEIFDDRFVSENVYAGHEVGHQQRKNLYRVIIGKEGVTLAEKIDHIDKESRAASKEINKLKKKLEKATPPGLTFEAFLNLETSLDINQQASVAEAKIKSLENIEDLTRQPLPQEISWRPLPFSLESILSRSIDDISKEARESLEAHLKAVIGKENIDWLERGIQLSNEHDCPFCGQDVSDSSLVSAYSGFFSEEYQDLINNVKEAQHCLDQCTGQLRVSEFERLILRNNEGADFWEQYVQFNKPTIYIDSCLSVMNSIQKSADRLLSRKLASPLEVVPLEESFKQALSNYDDVGQRVEEYNELIRKAVNTINNHKLSLKSHDLEEEKRTLSRLRAAITRHEASLAEKFERYNELLEYKERLATQKVTAKANLDSYEEGVLETHQAKINSYLGSFGAGFQIGNAGKKYSGGSPSSRYDLVINEVTVDLGGDKTPNGKPCFGNTLSGGDRSALALAFFLSRLDHDSNLSNTVVVFDDPITSMDHFRRTFTQQVICRFERQAKQVIVLSHDAMFLKNVWKGTYRRTEIKTMHICRSGTGSIVAEWDLELATMSEYRRNYNLLSRYLEHGPDGDLVSVAMTIRLLFEENLRMRFPEEFASHEWLGDFLRKIREASPTDSLARVKPSLENLNDLNDFSKPFHHRDNPGESSHTLTDAELRPYVVKALDLLRSDLSVP